MKNLAAIVLAAGEGKRMRSRLPKVLHECADLPLVAHVVGVALARKCRQVVVVTSPGGTAVREKLSTLFPKAPLAFVVQPKPLGTADAARVGLSALAPDTRKVMLVYGDVPLLKSETIAKLEQAARRLPLVFATTFVTDPSGYGRVVRGADGEAMRIVEHKDASPAEREIKEINAGVYVADLELLRAGLGKLSRRNAQNEAYLTDIVPLAARRGGVLAMEVFDASEMLGVNTRKELAEAEAIWQQRLVIKHQARGVTFRDPSRVRLGALVELGEDVELGVGVELSGRVVVGPNTRIDGPTVIRDAVIGSDVRIEAFCHIEGARVDKLARVGPFARLRPGTRVCEGAHVGNFVELKKTKLCKGAKANHLTYLGDAEIGPASNIGAGTITCNYDGTNKHKTSVGPRAFIGSNATLVAPLTLGRGVYVAAGSTITSDVPADALAFGRARQSNRAGYAARLRARLAAAKEKT